MSSSHVGRVSLTKDQQLLHRAVGHLYSKIIQPSEEGGWSEWFQEHCIKFDVKKKSEHALGYTELHKQFEAMVESALVEFTAQEGIEDAQDLYTRILNAKDDKKFESTVNLLLAAASYKKFVALMKRKHRQLIKQGATQRVRNTEKMQEQERAMEEAKRHKKLQKSVAMSSSSSSSSTLTLEAETEAYEKEEGTQDQLRK